MVPLNVDLRSVAFSRFGAYLAISHLEGEWYEQHGPKPGVWLRNLHGDGEINVFRLEPLQDGRIVPFDVVPGLDELWLKTDAGVARLCIAESNQLRIRVEDIGLRLTMCEGTFTCAVELDEDRWLLNAASAARDYTAVRLAGEFRCDD